MKYIRASYPSGRFAVKICLRQICHCCAIDGVFSVTDKALLFDAATITAEIIAAAQALVRERVPRLFKRRALLSLEDVNAMRRWGHEDGC